MRRTRGLSRFKAGLLLLVAVVAFSYFGFTKNNPFANPYELEAVFQDANNLKPRSPVRTAGVEIGKVTRVEPIAGGAGAARVTMEIQERGLPIKEDAELKIRSRIFLEGNFFVELRPGTPSAPVLEDGEKPIPMSQTDNPVQIVDVLRLLQRDTRTDLRTFFAEYGLKALGGDGATAFNRAIPDFKPAYRSTALFNEALLGVDPERDLQRLLRGQQQTFGALARDTGALQDLVTNLNVTAGALARENEALEASVPALRDTLRAGTPALRSLNASLPALRSFATAALPGVRSSDETIDAALPLISELRQLMGPAELQGVAAELRQQIPSLVTLNRRLNPFLSENRELSSCTNNVLVPFLEDTIPSEEEGNTGHRVREQIQRSFVGLAGESRVNDANTPFFHTQGVPPSDFRGGRIEPIAPSDPTVPPPHRPDVACETQEPPNLDAPSGPAADFLTSSGGESRARRLDLGSRLRRMRRAEGRR